MNRPLSFCGFFLCSGSFRDIRPLDFLSVSSQLVLNERVLWFFVWGHFGVNRPLGFCVFSRVRVFFAISGVWIFDFCFAFVVMSACPMISA